MSWQASCTAPYTADSMYSCDSFNTKKLLKSWSQANMISSFLLFLCRANRWTSLPALTVQRSSMIYVPVVAMQLLSLDKRDVVTGKIKTKGPVLLQPHLSQCCYLRCKTIAVTSSVEVCKFLSIESSSTLYDNLLCFFLSLCDVCRLPFKTCITTPENVCPCKYLHPLSAVMKYLKIFISMSSFT